MKIKQKRKTNTKIALFSLTVFLAVFGYKEYKEYKEYKDAQESKISKESFLLATEGIIKLAKQNISFTLPEEEVLFDKDGNPKYTITEEEANLLFYKNGELNVDNVGHAYQLSCYQSENDGYVRNIEKNGKKYLVDADNLCKVLLCDYDSFGRPFYVAHWGEYNDLYYYIVLKDDTHYVVNAKDFSIVLTNYDGFLLGKNTSRILQLVPKN